MFGRSDIPAEDMRTFAQWLATILIANRGDDAGYPLLDTEARSALRQAGADALRVLAIALLSRWSGRRKMKRSRDGEP